MPANYQPPRVVAQAPARFRIDLDQLAGLLLPPLLRKPRTLNWLWALLTPLHQLYAEFLTYRQYALRELTYNGQTQVLQQCLNDSFDPYSNPGRIRIVNIDSDVLPEYDYLRAENHEPESYLRFIGECPPWSYDRTQSEYDAQLDFTVWAPDGLNTTETIPKIHARINQFRPAGKRYRLRFYGFPYQVPG